MPMNMRKLPSVAVVCVAIFMSSCANHAKISVEDIQRDVVGKSTGDDYQTGWDFVERMPVAMQIVESHYKGDMASIVIDAKTMPDGGGVKKMAGRIRLHYEWIAGVWYLKRVESLSFKIVN